ncbi:putative bifunctional diguanylate cyclase/phosphodiesterase [Streptomyces odontomachi]|uniref:putative bifunctional diguanylate cyclase/phosphodiesterase n=1 Tax=Streptomyces odontomachi TaxID=2944940 RepID=UPI00210ABCE2|nr:EAL domain-containing protein [Streptomyces sp. ODS25]
MWARRPFLGGGSGRFPQCALALVCGGYAIGATLGWGSRWFALVMGDFGLSAAALAASVSCLLYARDRRSGLRPAWLLFAVSSLMTSLGNGVWGWYEVVLDRPVPNPSCADLFFLCFAPSAIVGLLVLAKRPQSKAGWICLGLDSWLIGGSLLTLSWSLALARTARVGGQSVQHVALSLAYPMLDIVLISMVLVLHFRRTSVNRSAVNTAIGALGLTVLSDALFTSPLLHANYHSGHLLDAGWFAGSLLLAYAPWAGGIRTGQPLGPASETRYVRGPALAAGFAPATGRTAGVTTTAAAHGSPASIPPGTFASHERYPVSRPSVGSLTALTPYLAAAVCTLGILSTVLDGRKVDRVVLFTACLVVLVLIVRQGIMLLDNMALARELAEKENHFRSLVQGSSDVIMIADPDGVLRYVSPAAAGVYGRDAEELIGSELSALIHPDDLGSVLHEIRRFLAASPHQEPTTRIECRFRSGGHQWLNVESTVNRHEGGLILNSRDVTERVRLQAQLQHNAEHDPLTDLPNRVLFTRRVGLALSGRRATDRGTAVLFIDLDGFKGINDTIGHQAGDELLVQAARRLREAVRQSDTPARLGGDEFAALVLGDGTPGTAREQHIYELADRLRAALSRPYTVDGHTVRVGASIGAAFAEPGLTAGELLRNADLAMYRAKAGGKGRVVLYAPQMRAEAVRKATFTSPRPRTCRHDSEFTLLHEPVVSLTNGRIVTVAAQARRRSPQGALLAPADFLRAVDDADHTADLGRWTFEAAVEQAVERSRTGHPVPVVVRTAARRLMDRSLPSGTIEALLTRHGLPSGSLIIELAGSDPHVPLDDLERRLAALRRHGVRIALDGFGSGYAAFNSLRRLPVDWLKLDRALIEGVVDSARLHKITSGLLRIASDLGLCSVADGVDRPEQVAALQAMGCTYGQGLAFSGPLDEYRLRRALAVGRFPVPRVPVEAVLTGGAAGVYSGQAATRSHSETPVPPP